MITLAITTYNRDQMVIEAIQNVLDDPRISEIVIVDDCSDQGFYASLKFKLFRINNPKIKLYRNEKNLDCYRNKREAVSKASNGWVMLLDSDNIMDKGYVDRFVLEHEKRHKEDPFSHEVIYTPEYAMPHFDFKSLSGIMISRNNVAELLETHKQLETLLNACNYAFNKWIYLDVWDGTVDPVTSDSIYFAYKWLELGCRIYVTPGMQYTHRIHSGSHYQTNIKRTPKGFHEEVLNKLRALK